MPNSIKDLRHLIFAVVRIAIQRILAQPGLALATIVGLSVAIGLTIGIPLYAESIYYRVLRDGLFSDNASSQQQGRRPPVALLFRYAGSLTGPRQWEDLEPVSRYFEQELHKDLRLPPSPGGQSTHLASTGLFGLFLERDANRITQVEPAYRVVLATIDEPETHLSLVEGAYPSSSTDPEDPVDVLVTGSVAEKMGIQVGDTYIAYDTRAQHRYEDEPARFDLRVAGIWEPSDSEAEFWEYSGFVLDNLFFVSEGAFVQRIAPRLEDEIYQSIWYMPLDAAAIHVDDVEPLLLRFEYVQRDVRAMLPGTILDVSPVKALERYQEAVNLLTFLLFIFSIPVLGLIVTFVALVVALSVERQRGEVASLRSRGATSSQIIGIGAVESTILGLVAFMIALPLSYAIAYSIGQTRGFLDFSLRQEMRIGITWGTARFGLLTLGITVVAQIIPLLSAARHTMVTYKTERARRLRPPWWQRVGLDLLLAIPAGYGTYLLSQQGSILMSAEEVPADPFENPLLLLIPALSLLAGTLLILRLLPLVVRFIAWVASLSRSVGLLMAARQLARVPGLYTAPLSLLILTISLSTYSASLAATLDSHLQDQEQYWVGADASVVDIGDAPARSSGSGPPPSVDAEAQLWRFLPVTEYLNLPDVEAAARVGRYEGRIQTTEGYQDGTYIGVDRSDFTAVAFWRSDFATESLGSLMNLLALREDAALLPYSFMRAHILNVGDTVNVVVRAYGTFASIPVTIVGGFDYFPSWYPETGPLVVGNLDYLHREAQLRFPYRVWLKTGPDADFERLEDELWALNLGAQGLLASPLRILREQQRPERQGLLGILSVGFSAAAVLAALGFVLYTLFSFRRRAVELGVLRAVGLSARQMISFVASELGILLAVGGAAGTGLGIAASNLYVPFLQIGAEMTARVPPFVVEIAWPALFRMYALFILLFVVALIILIRILTRMKLFQAIKLGETT
ncbi:MAG: ABC transporter permease [Anaerolineae bacterium]